MKKLFILAAALFAFPASAALDVREVALGAKEREIRQKFPSAHCKALEWKSNAADRRCDDSRVPFGGVEVQVTFYLKKDALEAFDVRFDTKELDRFVAFLKQRYGAPQSEDKQAIPRGKDRAVLTAQLEKRRASMLVSRGAFDEEIYRVR